MWLKHTPSKEYISQFTVLFIHTHTQIYIYMCVCLWMTIYIYIYMLAYLCTRFQMIRLPLLVRRWAFIQLRFLNCTSMYAQITQLAIFFPEYSSTYKQSVLSCFSWNILKPIHVLFQTKDNLHLLPNNEQVFFLYYNLGSWYMLLDSVYFWFTKPVFDKNTCYRSGYVV